MTVRELFDIAVEGKTKAVRRNAFRQLRELSQRGEPEVSREAAFALQHSAEYAQHEEARS
jgi:hypothetical protein